LKLLYYRVDTRKRASRVNKCMGFERMLFMLFILTFSVLIIVQAALMNPSVKTSLSMNDELEGKPLGIEEVLYNEGTIRLCLLNNESNSGVKVLINGEEAGRFSENTLDITVKDGDVVEIDGSNSLEEFEVAVLPVSDNISAECVNLKTTVRSNVVKVTRIRIK